MPVEACSCEDSDCDTYPCTMENGGWDTAKEVIELIDGVIIGALETEGVVGLGTCVKDFDPLVQDMVTAVQDFEDANYANIADGIYNLGQFVSQVGIVMTDCSSLSEADLNSLKEMGQAFEHPLKLVIDAENNVIVNGVEIFKDVRKGIKDLNDKKYQQAGKEFGTVAAMVLWGQKNYKSLFLQ